MERAGLLILMLVLASPARTFGTTKTDRRTPSRVRSRDMAAKEKAKRQPAERTRRRSTRAERTRTSKRHRRQYRASARPRKCIAKRTKCPGGWRSLKLKTKWCQGPFTVCTLRYGRTEGRPATTTILLHGLAGQASDWVRYAKIADTYRRLFQRKKVPSGVLVAVSGGNGYWTNWADRRHRYGDLIHTNLIQLLRHRGLLARSAKKTALVGVSAGGFGALSLALRFPKRFGRVLALSATDMSIATRTKGPVAIYKRVFGRKLPMRRIRTVNPVDLVAAGARLPVKTVLRWGEKEAPKFSEGGRRLSAALRKRAGSKVDAAALPGGKHGWRYWQPALEGAIDRLWKDL